LHSWRPNPHSYWLPHHVALPPFTAFLTSHHCNLLLFLHPHYQQTLILLFLTSTLMMGWRWQIPPKQY
jgi:hypothetical protein